MKQLFPLACALLLLAGCVTDDDARSFAPRAESASLPIQPPPLAGSWAADPGSARVMTAEEALAAAWLAAAAAQQQPAWGTGAWGAEPWQGDAWSGGSPADAWLGGDFYGNWNLGTAVSSSGGSGYIALGGGDFVSW